MLDGLTRDTLLHAYLINGSTLLKPTLLAALETLFGYQLHTSPDILLLEADTLTVDEARAVVVFASRAPIGKHKEKVVALIFSAAGAEAQNTLLKTLEEPPERTYIFMLTPNPDALLPTVRSRCHLVRDRGDVATAPLPTRDELLKEIEKLHKKKDATGMTALLNSLEVSIAASHNTDAKQALMQARHYWHDKGAMRKMLLESIALMV